MKKALKKILASVLVAVMILTAAPLSGFVGLKLNLDWLDFSTKSSALDASGQCGENVTYTFDESTGLLTISGTGDMTDYSWKDSPFYENSLIKNVVIKDGVTSIGCYAFLWCTGLTSITIPDSVKRIGFGAFSTCNFLTSVTIPDSVTSIGDSAFYLCTGLTSVTIPDSVTYIGELAFYNTGYYNNSSNWENDVLYIGNYLIEAKTALSGSYAIKDGTKVIAGNAFSYCTSLTSVTIPNSVISIGEDAFFASGLTNIIIPNSVIIIGDWAFSDCYGLTSVTVPNSVTDLGDGAFDFCEGLTNIIIGNSVKSIGDYTFRDCSALTSVIIPNSVTSIGKDAFESCSSLTSATIGNSVISIGDEAFYECTSLTSVTIPDSVTSIGDLAFNGCFSLKNISVDEKNQFYSSDEYGVLFNKDKTELIQYPSFNFREKYKIPESVVSVGDYAFFGCFFLTEVDIAEYVTNIGEGAFGYSAIENISLSKNIQTIGSYAFCCIKFSDTIKNDIKTNGLIFVENYDEEFLYSNISSSIKSITVDKDNEYYDSRDNCNAIIEKESNTLVFGCINSVIPSSVTSIGEGAFGLCFELTNIVIPDSVISIGDSAFEYCISLKDVFYSGTEVEWKNIKIKSDNKYLTNATIHYGVYSGDAVRKFFEEQGSDIIIDPETNCIYGVEPGSTSLSGDGSIGTGTKLSIMENGTATEYTVVIFGDTNGDGLYDGTDSVIVNCLANGMLTKEQVGDAAYSAADCNHDGVVDSLDVAILEKAGLSASTITQTK